MYYKLIPAEIEVRYLADPTADFAARLREQLAHELLPSIRICESLIGKFGGSIEMPSSKWFRTTYPYHDEGVSKEQHIAHVCCYSRAWASVEQQWAEGDFSAAQPTRFYPWIAFNMVMENIREAIVAWQELLDSESGQGQAESFNGFLERGGGAAARWGEQEPQQADGTT
jgi:hypothetical protein